MSESEIEAAAERYGRFQLYESSEAGDELRLRDTVMLATWACHRLAAERVEREEREASRAVVEYALTCDRDNTDEWMEGFAERINAWATVVGESDRVRYDAKRGQFRVLKGGEWHG